ncbi:MAG: histidine kinase [Flavitalea sp.]
MTQKGWQVLLGFILIFYLVVLIQDMPNLVNGHAEYQYIPQGVRGKISRLVEIGLRSLFALTAYCALLWWYPRNIPGVITGTTVSFIVILLLLFAIEPKGARLRFFFLSNVFYFLLYTAYGIFFFLLQYASWRDKQANELRAKQKDSELSFLRSQINPHFLFNSLNNIYSLVYERSEKSLEAIAGFSELMRYMLYNNDELITASTEINYIRRYIQLQQLRFDEQIDVKLEIRGNETGMKLPPLLLIPFVENAFKHGVVSNGKGTIVIRIDLTENEMIFYCNNQKQHSMKDQQGGIGIQNVRKRLDLLYPERFKLMIDDNDNNFTVNLAIKNA